MGVKTHITISKKLFRYHAIIKKENKVPTFPDSLAKYLPLT